MDNGKLLFIQQRPVDKFANGFIEWLSKRNGSKFSGKVKVIYHPEQSWNALWEIHENIVRFGDGRFADGWTRAYWEKLNAYTICVLTRNAKGQRQAIKPEARLAFLQEIHPGYDPRFVKSLAQYDAIIHLRSAKLKDVAEVAEALSHQCARMILSEVNDRQLAELLNQYLETINRAA